MPFERARTELLYGARLRRAGRRAEARDAARRALATFHELGAVPWAAQAREEIAASGCPCGAGGRARASDELSPRELQVARPWPRASPTARRRRGCSCRRRPSSATSAASTASSACAPAPSSPAASPARAAPREPRRRLSRRQGRRRPDHQQHVPVDALQDDPLRRRPGRSTRPRRSTGSPAPTSRPGPRVRPGEPPLGPDAVVAALAESEVTSTRRSRHRLP